MQPVVYQVLSDDVSISLGFFSPHGNILNVEYKMQNNM